MNLRIRLFFLSSTKKCSQSMHLFLYGVILIMANGCWRGTTVRSAHMSVCCCCARLCVAQRVCAWLCVPVRGSARLCLAVCAYTWLCATVRWFALPCITLTTESEVGIEHSRVDDARGEWWCCWCYLVWVCSESWASGDEARRSWGSKVRLGYKKEKKRKKTLTHQSYFVHIAVLVCCPRLS